MKKFYLISLLVAAVTFSYGCNKDNEGTGSSGSFTYQDAITAFDAFNSAFFEGRGIYARDTQRSGAVAVGWTQSMMFDMIMNAYKLSNDRKYLDMMQQHYNGFKSAFTFDWYDYSHWDLYDDMMWWVGSLARAYLLTGEKEYLEVSEAGFKRVWEGKPSNFDGTGWSELDAKGSFGGDDNPQYGNGMYWDWKFGRIGGLPRICSTLRPAQLRTRNTTGMLMLPGICSYITRQPQWARLQCFTFRQRRRHILTTPAPPWTISYARKALRKM